ncbi:MAG: hypothetical protein D1H97_12110 [Paracoccus sp. BP8]|nr:MAG: hypothetical protein D1H97_12110 [Paracoccus sp. BP8]
MLLMFKNRMARNMDNVKKAGRRETQAFTTGGPGLTIVSPDGRSGAAHFIVESPNFPFGIGDVDIASGQEQAIELQAQGKYIIDNITIWAPARIEPGAALLTLRTLDQKRGGGLLLVENADLGRLAEKNAIQDFPIRLGEWQEAPYLYAQVSPQGIGTVRVQIYGRILSLADHHARSSYRDRLR